MDKAIDRLEKTTLPSGGDEKAPELTPLTQVLLGMKPMAARTTVQNIEFFDPNMNDSQKEAVTFCLESPELACIHGPPGTFLHSLVPRLLSHFDRMRHRKDAYTHRDHPSTDFSNTRQPKTPPSPRMRCIEPGSG